MVRASERRLLLLGPVSQRRRREVVKLHDKLFEEVRKGVDHECVVEVWLDSC